MIGPRTLAAMSDEFLAACGYNLDVGSQQQAREYLRRQFHQMADVLPEPDAWTVIGRREDAILMLIAADALSRSPGCQTRTGAWGSPVIQSGFGRSTIGVTISRRFGSSVFRDEDRDVLTIEGKFDIQTRPGVPETFDRSERFARALAGKGGWHIEASPDG